MADSALIKMFTGLLQRKGPPKVNGRPKRTSTISDLAPVPKGIQTQNPTRAKIPPLPPIPGKM